MSLPVEINPHLLGSAAGYQIERSLRFNSADSAYLSRTPGSAPTAATKGTWSYWIKRTKLATEVYIIGSRDGGNSTTTFIRIESGDTLRFYNHNGTSVTWNMITSQVFRDVGAWMHIVVALDTTQATDTNRIKIYVNGTQVTAFGTASYPAQNATMTRWAANGIPNYIGNEGTTPGNYGDYYLTETYYIDGSALDPTSFGEFNTDTGVWQPKAYTGSYGTNGFYLNFSDNSGTTSTTLGKDSSGNGNNWTPNNFSVTAGAGNDSLVDTPTNNCATWNPLFFRRNGNKPVFSEGNKKVAGQSSQVSHTGSTIGSSGKHYAEFLVTDGTSTITGPGVVRDYWDGGMANSYAHNYGGSFYADDGTRYYNATSDAQTAPGSDRVGIEVDFGGNEVSYYIVQSNGTRTLQGSKLTSANGIDFKGRGIFTATLHDTSSRTVTAFFNSDEWWGTPTSGYTELNTQNLPEPTIKDGGDYFNTVLYTGNGSTQSITGVGFQPDFVWIKRRSGDPNVLGNGHNSLYNVIRGATKELYSDLTSGEATNAGSLTSFNTDGFSLGSEARVNANANTHVAWNWVANGVPTANNNSEGSITSTVSVNTTSGFAIVTYTGTGSAANVGHGLGVVPSMVIVKDRTQATTWWVYHASIGATKYLELNSTTGEGTSSTAWNDTSPTSTVFSVGTNTSENTKDYVAYCFAAIPGYSAFGSYTGNGNADGPLVYLGFTPAFVMIKQSSAAGEHWGIIDSKRDEYNVSQKQLLASSSTTEASTSNAARDYLSNGFKLRTSHPAYNASGSTYIYMAFASNPFKYSLAR